MKILSSLIGIACLLGNLECNAQPRREQFGAIDFEETGKKIDSYAANQEVAINLFKDLSEKIERGDLNFSAIPALGDEVASYLTGVYLYCSMKSGICPMVPEAVFELDVINAAVSNRYVCPNTRNFWTHWVRNGMEERQSYSVQIGQMQAVHEFNTKRRPQMLKCENSFKEIFKEASGSALLKSRYAKDSPNSQYFSSVLALMQVVKEKVPNIFYATGAIRPVESLNKEGAKSGAKTTAPNSRKTLK